MKKKLALRILFGVTITVLILLTGPRVFAETKQADINGIPGPESFKFTLAYLVGMLSGIGYKAGVGAFKNFYRGKFSLRQLLFPIIAAICTSIPVIIIVLPHLAPPSEIFSNDFFYTFSVAWILCDVGSDTMKFGGLMRRGTAKK